MGSYEEPAMRLASDERDILSSRIIPTMTLSTAANPHTAPLPPFQSTDPDARANARFAIVGNAIVTGGAGTLGLVVARALLEHGASGITLFDLPTTLQASTEVINRLKLEFGQRGRTIAATAVDITKADQVDEAVREAAVVMGTVDMLCCLAGIVDCSHSISTKPARFSHVMDVNLVGSFICAQAVAKQMITQQSGGSITFTASISAHHTNFPQPQVAYNVSKAAVVHLTRNLAVEWARYGVRVNCISPGYMDTVLNAGDNLGAIREVWANNNPMGRMGAVEEITGPFVLLNSRRAGRYINGVDILVDGGAMCL